MALSFQQLLFAAPRLLKVEDSLEGLPDLVSGVDLSQGVLAQTVAQAQGDDTIDVTRSDLSAALKGCQRLGSAVGHNVTTDAIHIQLTADLADLHAVFVRHLRLLHQLARLHDFVGQRVLALQVVLAEGGRVLIELTALGHDLDAQLRLPDSADLCMHAKSIQQLWSQLSLLWVTAAHKDEARRVADADTLTLDSVPARGSRIQQHIHQVVIQQVDLIYIQDAPVGLCQQARLKGLYTFCQGLLNVDGAAHAVLCGSKGQVDHGNLHGLHGQLLTSLEAHADLFAHDLGIRRVRVESVFGHHLDLREQVSQGTDGGGLPGASVTHDHHTSNLGVNHVQNQGQLHLLLAHNGSEWEDGSGSTFCLAGGLGGCSSPDLQGGTLGMLATDVLHQGWS
mmetsp:Transcript_19820/g.51517  ORF Transcript_19820/g.51517 Transcript_19820/m.51517 type:complete len:394 (+) Transcript_19820:3129-4310(+)